MGCNCKKIKKFQDKYGVVEEEEKTILKKINRWLFKALLFGVAIIMATIAVPYIVFYSVYAITFGDNKITLPLFMRKYME